MSIALVKALEIANKPALSKLDRSGFKKAWEQVGEIAAEENDEQAFEQAANILKLLRTAS